MGRRFVVAFLGGFLICLSLGSCTQQPSPQAKSQVEYLRATEARLGEWQQILDNLRRNRDMHAVHSELYRKRSETVQTLEKEVSQAQSYFDHVRQAQEDADAKAKLEAKLTEMKEGYFRPSPKE